MSLVFVPPAPLSPAGEQMSAGTWWPAIDINAMRDALRLGDVVTAARMDAAVRGALITVMSELRDWQLAQLLTGVTTLANVRPLDTVDGVPVLVECFTRAVRFHAAAELAVLHRDITATAEGGDRADAVALTADDYRALATHAIRDVIGATRTAVELI